MIGYAPKEIYEHRATVLEMICASTCLTSMLCFSLEKKYRGKRLYDAEALNQEHRIAARGNVTSFPLPWIDILQQLQSQTDMSNGENQVELPRSGEEISNFVSVLLKTADAEDDKEALGKFVHQAIVRRHVVIDLIEKANLRCHNAHAHVDLTKMKTKVGVVLPTNCILPAIAK